MSRAIPLLDYTSVSFFPSIGFGKASERLEKYVSEIVREFKKAESFRHSDEALRSLDEAFEECAMHGWDGYDALSLSVDAYYEAQKFIKSLPLISPIPAPEIIPEPDGGIALEWLRGKRQVFVASVSGRNEINYAGLFGTNKVRGTEYFGDYLPSAILENLKRLYC